MPYEHTHTPTHAHSVSISLAFALFLVPVTDVKWRSHDKRDIELKGGQRRGAKGEGDQRKRRAHGSWSENHVNDIKDDRIGK